MQNLHSIEFDSWPSEIWCRRKHQLGCRHWAGGWKLFQCYSNPETNALRKTMTVSARATWMGRVMFMLLTHYWVLEIGEARPYRTRCSVWSQVTRDRVFTGQILWGWSEGLTLNVWRSIQPYSMSSDHDTDLLKIWE